MADMAQDICPSCGAFLILAEVQYLNPAARPGGESGSRPAGSRLVYECPACRAVFARWMHDDEPLLPMGAAELSLRVRVAAWRRVSEV
jgi:hypothetical protein